MKDHKRSTETLFFFVMHLNLSSFEIRRENKEDGKNRKPSQNIYDKERFLENFILFLSCKSLLYPVGNILSC